MAVNEKTKKVATDALDTASSIAVSSWQPLLVIGAVGLAIYFGKTLTPSDLFIWLQKELDTPAQRAELKRLFPNTF